MCGFFYLRSHREIKKNEINLSTSKLKFRGPDGEGFLKLQSDDGYYNYFSHFLLDISGKKILQPIEDDKNILLFNGEIYNYDTTKYLSDTNYLLNTNNDIEYFNNENLDGEYAYIKYNKRKNVCFVAIDAFMTKPIFFGFNFKKKLFGISSYKSPLKYFGMEIKNFEPNSLTKFFFDNENFVKKDFENSAKKFNLNQNTNSFEKWENAFLKAIKKRASHGSIKPFVSLSSGYDSGAICCALNLLNIEYETFSIFENENSKIINDRIYLNKKNCCTRANVVKGINYLKKIKNERDIKKNIDDFNYFHKDRERILKLSQDGGSIGSLEIAKIAKKNKFKVHLSSCGADEIISDYGHNGEKYFSHSEFGGKFPQNLESIFPWKKFYGDSQRSYLFKEEYIFGRHGLESRYPFLDKDLVQSYLNLSHNLKNSSYKSPIEFFLNKNNYPFEKNKKAGFNPRKYSYIELILKKLNI